MPTFGKQLEAGEVGQYYDNSNINWFISNYILIMLSSTYLYIIHGKKALQSNNKVSYVDFKVLWPNYYIYIVQEKRNLETRA